MTHQTAQDGVTTAMEEEIRRAYHDLEGRMKALAEADGHVYLPNPEPTTRVDYILIAMEPSLGHWARSGSEARVKVGSGFRNFLVDMEPMLLHFSVRRFLCDKGQHYHITDFSKGAMLVKQAGGLRADRYKRWYGLLMEEIDLISAPGARVIAVGKAVAENLTLHEFLRDFTTVIHYSPLASSSRTARLIGREAGFRKFESSLSLEDVLVTAQEVLAESRVPAGIYQEALTRLGRSQLTESRRKLVYGYKLDFEAIKAARRREAPFLA
jgi:hypothetical protein